MKTKQLARLGILSGRAQALARRALRALKKQGLDRPAREAALRRLAEDPAAVGKDPTLGPLARAVLAATRTTHPPVRSTAGVRADPVPCQTWGEGLEPQAVQQMDAACRLPVAVRGALMPDAHLGYGLPIGGVLATRRAVIPYAVGVDIACRMRMTVTDLPPRALVRRGRALQRALERETGFGVGVEFGRGERRQHPVMDEDWAVTPVTAPLKDKAWRQLGTSGSGNHFVEVGELALDTPDLGLPAGRYLALLSHSGSRGAGAQVASHYSRVAMARHPDLPKALRHLAWLPLDEDDGQAYWAAMELMGRYAAANHACIHRHVLAALGAEALLTVENHHNFAWKERHDREEVIVHRKGATPADEGTLGIIPGTMADPAYVVRGLGNAAALRSASHGAGRRMSRTAAKRRFRWKDVRALLRDRGVTLLSAGLDEVPMAYKNIDEVMAAQRDLVRPVARFQPRLVKMAPAGERPFAAP